MTPSAGPAPRRTRPASRSRGRGDEFTIRGYQKSAVHGEMKFSMAPIDPCNWRQAHHDPICSAGPNTKSTLSDAALAESVPPSTGPRSTILLTLSHDRPMALSSAYVLPTNRIPEIFSRIRDGQAPDAFTQQLLRDWGFTSTNDRAFVPLLKGLGFLSADGKPTQRYHDYRDHSRSPKVMAQALREAYGDIFLIKELPSSADRAAIEGKFKSFHNVSENVAMLMAKTFLSLLPLADLTAKQSIVPVEAASPGESPKSEKIIPDAMVSGLHYNIQIHLPATKDVEVYNSIFKSLREHLFQ